jgi:Flp pilus assembly pilin Flp
MRIILGIFAFMTVVLIAVIILIGEWIKRRKSPK